MEIPCSIRQAIPVSATGLAKSLRCEPRALLGDAASNGSIDKVELSGASNPRKKGSPRPRVLEAGGGSSSSTAYRTSTLFSLHWELSLLGPSPWPSSEGPHTAPPRPAPPRAVPAKSGTLQRSGTGKVLPWGEPSPGPAASGLILPGSWQRSAASPSAPSSFVPPRGPTISPNLTLRIGHTKLCCLEGRLLSDRLQTISLASSMNQCYEMC